MKYDLISTLKSEATKYSELQLKYPLASTPGTFTSSSSSTVYTYTTDADLFSQLQTVLADYIISASDWNTLSESVDDAIVEIDTAVDNALIEIEAAKNITDETTSTVYKFVIDNGILFLEEV